MFISCFNIVCICHVTESSRRRGRNKTTGPDKKWRIEVKESVRESKRNPLNSFEILSKYICFQILSLFFSERPTVLKDLDYSGSPPVWT